MCDPTAVELYVQSVPLFVKCNSIHIEFKQVEPGTKVGDRRHWNHFSETYEVMDTGGSHMKLVEMVVNGNIEDISGDDVYRYEHVKERMKKATILTAESNGEEVLSYDKGRCKKIIEIRH